MPRRPEPRDAATIAMIVVLAAGPWLLAAAGPLVVGWLGSLGGSDQPLVRLHDDRTLLVNSAGWAVGIGVGATLLGWMPGRALARRHGRLGAAPWAAALLLPLCVPPAILAWCWWQTWPAAGPVHRWAVHHDLVGLLRGATLALGLLGWAWPVAAWCISAGRLRRSPGTEVLVRLDGLGRRRRLELALREDAPILALAATLVAGLVLAETTAFELANVFTLGNELRAMDAAGGASAAVLRAARPSMLLAIVPAAALLVLLVGLVRTNRVGSGESDVDHPVRGRSGTWSTGALLVGLLGGPALIACLHLADLLAALDGLERLRTFGRLYGDAALGSLALAGVVGAMAAFVTIALALCLERLRPLGATLLVGWLLVAAVPSTVLAIGLESMLNRPGPLETLYRSPLPLVLGLLGRGGLVVALVAAWGAARRLSVTRLLRRLDGTGGPLTLAATTAPALVAIGLPAAAISATIAAGEVLLTARLRPPGLDLLGPSLLHAMHYQRPDTVMLSMVGLLALAGIAAAAAGMVAGLIGAGRWRADGRRACLLVGLGLTTLLVGCGDDADGARPLPSPRVIGSVGLSPGQFSYPRGLAVDQEKGWIYVVDKSARVQRFDLEGELLSWWRMPEWELGKPVGLSVGPDGLVYVADTHYHRVIVFDPEGRERRRFGGYGTEPGQFIYPTDVAVLADGRLLVAEYGGNDRIQIVESDGTPVRTFGEFGAGDGAFNRPQSIELLPAGTVMPEEEAVLVADACNHRLLVMDLEGNLIRTIAGPGRAPGRVGHPYGVFLLPDQTFLVAEFGNNRVQRFDLEGRSRGIVGRVGFEPGELQYPWAVGALDGRLLVLDSGNSRLQVSRLP